MKKISPKLLLNYFITWVLIPGMLILFWIGFSLFFTSKYSLTVIASPHEKNDFSSYKTTELLAKQKLVASFKANEDNLGIVAVRFWNFQNISDDSVIFRIKDKTQKNWFYQNTYKVNQFQPDQLFTFGFPIIDDSKGKEYLFEIESIQGKTGDAIALSKVYPPFVSQYQYPKEALLANKGQLFEFIYKKLYYSFSDRNFLISSLVFLLPLIFYVFWCYLARVVIGVSINPLPRLFIESREIISESSKSGYILFQIYFIILLLLVFLFDERNLYVSTLIIVLWVWLIKLCRFEGKVSYLLGIFFLTLCPIFIIFKLNDIAERSAMWAYFFLVVGTLMAFLESIKAIKPKVTYTAFLKQNYASLKSYVNKGE